jgi:DsbC/DsbD-like thiol-disulfide interchange protein
LTFAGVVFAALAGAAGAAGGEGVSGRVGRSVDDPEKPRAKARLISEHTALTPGQTAFLGVSFEIEKGWHIYWNGAGDTGMPVQVEVQLPEGYEAGELLWPAPKRHISPGDLLDYIYEGRVTLLLPIAVPADARSGDEVRISAQLDWLECQDICLPGSASLELSLPVASDAAEKSSDAARFEEARRRIPRPIPETGGSGIETTWQGRRLQIRASDAAALSFYPGPDCARALNPLREGATKGDTLSIEFEPGRGGKTRVVGVLEVSYPGDRPPAIYAVDLAGPAMK